MIVAVLVNPYTDVRSTKSTCVSIASTECQNLRIFGRRLASSW